MIVKPPNIKCLIWLLLVTVFWNFGCKPTTPSGEKQTLTFFILRSQNFDGGRFFRVLNFPSAGYIAKTPDLIIAQLRGVKVTSSQVPNVIIDQYGNKTDGGMVSNSVLHIEFMADDAKKFELLTEKAIGEKVLVMLGDKPIMAPKVITAISTDEVLVTSPKGDDEAGLEKQLKTLVKPTGSEF